MYSSASSALDIRTALHAHDLARLDRERQLARAAPLDAQAHAMLARRYTDLHGRIVADLGTLPPVDQHAVWIRAIARTCHPADDQHCHVL